jgi:hypothetical protein
LYYYNPSKNAFEFLSTSKADNEGNVNLDFKHASDYVMVIDDNIHIDESLLDDLSINLKRSTLYIGGTKGSTNELSISLPDALSANISKGLINYNVTYSSNMDSVATVSSKGVITAKAIGNANITTTVTVGDASTSFETKITVKEAYIKFVKYKISMKTGEKVSFAIKLYGFNNSDISWLTTKKKIVAVKKNSGKLTAQVSAVSKGTDYLLVKGNNVDGSTVEKQLKITVK